MLWFVVGSLVPSIAIAVLSFATVTRQLRRASVERLDHTSTLLGQALVRRLTLLSRDLEWVPGRAAPCPSPATELDGPACDEALLMGFRGLSFTADAGAPVRLFGPSHTAPGLTEADLRRLDAGTGVVLEGAGEDGRPALMLARAAAPGGPPGILIGLVSSGYLAASQEQTPLLPGMRFDLVDSAGRVLFSSVPGEARVPDEVLPVIGLEGSGTFEWRAGDRPWVAAWRVLAPGDEVSTPRFALVVSEERAAVMAPLGAFRRTFPVVLAVGLGIAMLLGFGQLRQSLVPLHALHAGTRRLARQEFDEPVVVTSRDEFADLAASFNAMAEQIRRQFVSLSSGAEFDRAVLSSVDTTRIVEAVLNRLPELCGCDAVGVTLLQGPAGAEVVTWVRDPEASRGIASWGGAIADEMRDRLAGAPDGLEHTGRPVPNWLLPVAGAGERHLWSLPLLYQGRLLGAITLGGFSPATRAEEEVLRARRVAGPVALALANAQMVEQMRFLAFRDSLTGLPNRHAFKQTLGDELARRRAPGHKVALLFLDLDHFSRINDTLGHTVGDRLVREVGGRIQVCCEQTSTGATVARLGGDEFTVILPDLPGDEAVEVARQLLASFRTPFLLDGHEVFVTTSIGIALHPTDGITLETLIRNADAAVYQAKRNGRNRFETYSAAMTTTTARRLTLESHLRRGLEAEQFVVWYQPIADLATGRIVSAEALVRWEHPEWGLVEPAEFITTCEETGLIVPLGDWIMKAVCRQQRAWQDAGLRVIPIACNVSAQQLNRVDAVRYVGEALQETGLEPGHLTLELTESILMDSTGDTSAAIHGLAELGVRLAIDDFGTGYSSLSYLKHFPVHTVKVDRSFIRDIVTNPDDAALTAAIVAIGQALDLRVVAEGVETTEQVALLRGLGCDSVQGYLIARPLPASEFSAVLEHDEPVPVLRTRGSGETGRRRAG